MGMLLFGSRFSTAQSLAGSPELIDGVEGG